jgi:1-acyl-sn-glycerol-3-phosphate acyltransferase
MDTLEGRERVALQVQLVVSRILSPLWIPVLTGVMRLGLGWRIEGADEVRREYRRLREQSHEPILVCANHLTMLDSFVIGLALGSPGYYLRHFGALPWNTPERVHFASTWWKRVLIYVLKCVPVTRGASRAEVAKVLAKVRFLLQRGQAVLIFPEGGRSRSGRVDVEAAAWGVGRVVTSLPGCRVACVYLRGEGQEAFSDAPRRGERFHAAIACIEPKSDHGGLRGSVEVAQQIVGQLADMERRYFDGRQ